MNKYMMMLAAAGLIAVAPVAISAAQAEDHAPAAEATTTTEVKDLVLKDGTKVQVDGEMVYVIGDGNTKTAAPDGEHELADGTKIKTMGGKIVTEAEGAAH